MNNESPNIEERLAQLPEDVRAAVLSVEWEKKVQTIGARHQLHVDQQGALGDTTLMAMLGMYDLVEYPTHVATDVGIAADQAATIAKEVSDEIFMPIRESLKKVSAKPATTPEPKPRAQTFVPAAGAPLAKPDLSAANTTLSTAVVQAPVVTPPTAPTKTEPPKPAAYSADPYREPPV